MSGPHPDPMAPDAHLEPAAVGPYQHNSQHGIELSMAISLKRIADAIAGDGTNQGIGLTLFYIERRLAQLAER